MDQRFPAKLARRHIWRGVAAARLRFLVQAPRVAALFELRDDVIGDGIPVYPRSNLVQAPNDFLRFDKRKGDAIAATTNLPIIRRRKTP